MKRLAEEVSRDPDYQISVLAPEVADSPYEHRFGGIPVRRFRYWPIRKGQLLTQSSIRDQLIRYPWLMAQVPIFLIAEFFALRQEMRREPAAIIHAHWLFPQGCIAAFYKRFIRPSVRIVCTVHGSDVNVLRGAFFRAIHRWTMKVINAVIVVSPSLAENRLFSGHKNLKIISMGFDPIRPPQEEVEVVRETYDRGPILLFVGRLVPAKNLDKVIDAMPEVWKHNSEATLLIIGDGPFRKQYESQAARSDRPGRIHFLGSMPAQELAVFYAAADVLVAASSSEGFGLIFLEALSAGLPIVTTPVGIIPHLSNNAIHTFSLGAGPVQMATVINESLEHGTGPEPGEREELEARYGWRSVATQYLTVYREVAAKADSTGQHTI
ncbi:MAG: glycosyltransferase [Candidatus Komeilibacteria bacterium]|nr:glycosyltransferase [Candidatus Komeilibacteria bacterium]